MAAKKRKAKEISSVPPVSASAADSKLRIVENACACLIQHPLTNTKFVRVAVLNKDDDAGRFAHNDQDYHGDPYDFDMHVGSKHVMIGFSEEDNFFGRTANFQQPASRSGWLTISEDNFEFSFAFLQEQTLVVSKGANNDGGSILVNPAKHILAQVADSDEIQWVLERSAEASDAEILKESEDR